MSKEVGIKEGPKRALACPFCGCPALTFCVDEKNRMYFVQCNRCKTNGPRTKSYHMAAAMWGSRCESFLSATLDNYDVFYQEDD